jgi:hypothetical protein
VDRFDINYGMVRPIGVPHAKSPAMADDDETIKDLERDRRQDKEIDRRDAVGMVPEKRPPALRRWPPAAIHIPGAQRR